MRIYLAGPDVFFPDVEERFAHLRAICAEQGMTGITPFDGGMGSVQDLLDRGKSRQEVAQEIYLNNMRLIQSCDGVLANMEPFRGPVEPDSGTVFEVGVAVALGKPVATYLRQQGLSLIERLAHISRPSADGQGLVDTIDGAVIEDFGQSLNVMLACSCEMFDSPQAAIQGLALSLGRPARLALSP